MSCVDYGHKLRYLKVDMIGIKNPDFPEVYSYYDPLEIWLSGLRFSKMCFTCDTLRMLPGKKNKQTDDAMEEVIFEEPVARGTAQVLLSL